MTRKWLKRWWRDRGRTSWLWCYVCRHDLNGDDRSFVEERDLRWFYRCASCGAESVFSLEYPIPVRVEKAHPND